MSGSIDERVVSMKFNNKQFEQGVQDTAKSLDNLKNKLNLSGAAKGLDELSNAGSRFSLGNIANGVDTIASKFTALGVIGVTALANITSKAVNAGLQMLDSFTTAPIKDGFDEYELKMGSIQTILANTARHGTGLDDVTAALDDLNSYADKTIYNFGAMTKNIGLFTNAGIKLEDATSMIKGFSNAAAASGTTAEGAAGAAQQLSQALSVGVITAQDWISLSNVGMGNKNMQEGLVQIAEATGQFNENTTTAEEATNNFKGSLEKKWMSADVMSSYLRIMAGDMDAAGMAAIGLSQAQIDSFAAQQVTAEEAATKVRTYTQLVGTLQEAVGSGWAESFGIIIGEFDEATDLFTHVSNTLGEMIGGVSAARNDMLNSWKDAGGREVAIEAITNAFNALLAVFEPVKKAWALVFPAMSGDQLYNITVAIRDFTAALTPSAETMGYLQRIFMGLFSVLDIGWMVLKEGLKMFGGLFGAVGEGSGGILNFAAEIGDLLTILRGSIKHGTGLTNFFEGLGKVLKAPITLLQLLGSALGDIINGMTMFDTSGVSKSLEDVGARLNPIARLGGVITGVWGGIVTAWERVADFFAPFAAEMGNYFGGIATAVGDAMSNMGDLNFDAVLDAINTGLFGGLLLLIRKFLKNGITGELNVDVGGGLIGKIKEVFGGVTDTMTAMQGQLKAGTLLRIAGAIALLTVSVVALSMIDSAALTKALAALTVMFVQVGAAMAIFGKIAMGPGIMKLPVLAAGLILLAIGINILVIAVTNLSKLNWKELIKGLGGVTVLLGALVTASNLLSRSGPRMIAGSVGLIAMAVAIKILASAVTDLSGLSWKEMAKGLAGVGAILAGVVLFSRTVANPKGMIATSAALILLGVALKVIASALKDFADISWSEMGRGLVAMAGALVIIGLAMNLMPSNLPITAVGLVIVAAALHILAGALIKMSAMSWDDIGRVAVILAGSLLIIAGAMYIMVGALPGAAALIVVAASLNIMAGAFLVMSEMSWDDIGRVAVILAGSLLIIAGAMYIMVGALPGAAALIVVAAALSILAPVLIALGAMSWSEILIGLAALAGVFLIIGVAGLLLTPVIPTLIGLGIAIVLLGVGAMAAGVGMLAFSVGLTALSVAGAAGTVALVGMVSALIGLIPMAMEGIGLGIVAMAGVITAGAPAIVEAIVAVLVSLMDAVIVLGPKVVETLTTLVFMMVDSLVSSVPRFVVAGMTMLTGIIDGIANNISKIVDSATSVITNFIDGLAQNIPRITESGANLIITFVESLATSVRNNSERMGRAGGDLASAMIEGMSSGITAGAGKVIESAKNLAGNAIQGAKDFLQINSPSKKFFHLGEGTGEGLVGGIDSYGNAVAKSAAGMGAEAVDGMKKSMSGISSAIGTDANMSPVIRPVLDLSAVKKDGALIGGMMGKPAVSVGKTYSMAASVSADRRAHDEAVKDRVQTESVTNVSLVQNNSSPRSLSSVDIYRQTQNQLSTAKKVLEK